MNAQVTVIIPTMNNREYLLPCLESLLVHRTTPGLFEIIVVNNGDPKSLPSIINSEVRVISAGKNLGWEGGLKLGMQHTDSPFLVFMNDDTYVPLPSAGWIYNLLAHFGDPKVGAVGPISNVVMGPQNMFIPMGRDILDVRFLIGFCMIVRRSALEEAGGIDDSMPNHGDDLDLSIRMRQAGYKLICDRKAFIFHHGFKTGSREFGAEWNSVLQTEKTNHRLIKKHGLKAFWGTMSHPIVDQDVTPEKYADKEGQFIASIPMGEKVLELGCGDVKTVPQSIGVDVTPKGERIHGLVDKFSVADIVADVSKPLPVENGSIDCIIARHVLEHVVNQVKTLRQWWDALKPGGQLIIAVPDQALRSTIPLSVEHVHAFDKESLQTLVEMVGFKMKSITDVGNDLSFVGVFEKHGH